MERKPFVPLVERAHQPWQKAVVVVSGVLFCLVVSAMVDRAFAWGDSTPCGSSHSGTTRWSAFAGHYQDVYERICIRHNNLRYARKPVTDYPTRNIIFGPRKVST